MGHMNKKMIRMIGAGNYRKIVVALGKGNRIPHRLNPGQDGILVAKQTLQDVVSMTLAARKAYGTSRMLVATKACEFIRMVTGSDDTEICIAGGYYCQDCETQPVHGFKWWSCENTGELDGMFCAANGCAYDKGRRAGLIAFADKQNPEKSFVVKTRMPSGKTANLLYAMKLVNMMRLGEFPFSEGEIHDRRHGGIGEAIKSFIAEDDVKYYRNIEMLRRNVRAGTITYPDLDRYKPMPEFKVCQGKNDVTLKPCDKNRAFAYYDVGKVFNKDEESEPTDEAWKAILNMIIESWTVAEAACIYPEKLSEWTTCSKKDMTNLRNWTYVRATGCWPPASPGAPMEKADPATIAWAAKPFMD